MQAQSWCIQVTKCHFCGQFFTYWWPPVPSIENFPWSHQTIFQILSNLEDRLWAHLSFWKFYLGSVHWSSKLGTLQSLSVWWRFHHIICLLPLCRHEWCGFHGYAGSPKQAKFALHAYGSTLHACSQTLYKWSTKSEAWVPCISMLHSFLCLWRNHNMIWCWGGNTFLASRIRTVTYSKGVNLLIWLL